jgi:hypothetical protein
MPDHPIRRGRHLAIRHVRGHQVVAEIVSPSNKDRKDHVRALAQKVIRSLEVCIDVLLIDVLPTMVHDAGGLHAAVWRWLDTAACEPPAERPLMMVSSIGDGEEPRAFLESVTVGQRLIDMLLFLTTERYVNVPLEPTDRTTYQGMPEFWRRVREQSPAEDGPSECGSRTSRIAER